MKGYNQLSVVSNWNKDIKGTATRVSRELLSGEEKLPGINVESDNQIIVLTPVNGKLKAGSFQIIEFCNWIIETENEVIVLQSPVFLNLFHLAYPVILF